MSTSVRWKGREVTGRVTRPLAVAFISMMGVVVVAIALVGVTGMMLLGLLLMPLVFVADLLLKGCRRRGFIAWDGDEQSLSVLVSPQGWRERRDPS